MPSRKYFSKSGFMTIAIPSEARNQPRRDAAVHIMSLGAPRLTPRFARSSIRSPRSLPQRLAHRRGEIARVAGPADVARAMLGAGGQDLDDRVLDAAGGGHLADM